MTVVVSYRKFQRRCVEKISCSDFNSYGVKKKKLGATEKTLFYENGVYKINSKIVATVDLCE